MGSSHPVTIGAVLLLACAAAGCGESSKKAAGQPPKGAEGKVRAFSPVWTVPNKSPGDVAAYWTPERIASAKPYDIVVSGQPSTGPQQKGGEGGKPVSIPPQPPEGGAPMPQSAKPEGVHQDSADAGSQGRLRYARYLWPGSSVALPARTFGKVFFTKDGKTWVCSGTAVTSKNESVVWTAGHCVVENGQVHTNWVFIPGYESRTAPYGQWIPRDVNSMFSIDEWIEKENNRYDLAAVVVQPLSGKTLESAVGSQGIRFRLPARQRFLAFGYPQGPPFDGQHLYVCDSRTGARDLPGRGAVGPATIGIGCDMTGGSSGGGWVTGSYKHVKGWGWVDSVVSYHYDTLPEVRFGPYQDGVAMALWRVAQNY